MDADLTRYAHEMNEDRNGDYVDFGEAEGVIEELEAKVSSLEEEVEILREAIGSLEDTIAE